MNLDIRPLTPYFAAEIRGVDLTGPVDDATVHAVKAALDQFSVLIFRDQAFTDERQVAFSARFGPLERTVYKAEGDGGVPVANITNVDFRTNELFPPDHPRVRGNRGNEMWHTDSSFKPVPAYCSMLSGREVPPSGGDTEFASCRQGYRLLSESEAAPLDQLVAEHNYAYSRSLLSDYVPPNETLNEVPPVQHALIRSNPNNAARNFYAGAHASHIVGWPLQRGRALLRTLVEKATQSTYVYRHAWRPFDFVMWDNRCVLHRATPFAVDRYRRVMRRTTVAGVGPTVDDTGRPLVGV
ncbi:MAG: TauD/TfdA family dioxygenase [Pseudomonadota bacterium]